MLVNIDFTLTWSKFHWQAIDPVERSRRANLITLKCPLENLDSGSLCTCGTQKLLIDSYIIISAVPGTGPENQRLTSTLCVVSLVFRACHRACQAPGPPGTGSWHQGHIKRVLPKRFSWGFFCFAFMFIGGQTLNRDLGNYFLPNIYDQLLCERQPTAPPTIAKNKRQSARMGH